MTHRERRDMERAQDFATGDPRALLLAATPANCRSEVAARYDHKIEADELDRNPEPTSEDLHYERMMLWRASVAIELAENAGYRDIVSRYMGRHRVSDGMARAITDAEAKIPFPSDADVMASWQRGRETRRIYLRLRYGV